ISQLLNKSLNLAEAGIGLGVTLVTRLGSLVKEQAIDKIIPDKLDIMGLSS
ncbi:MAG: hypothetical protein GWN61_15455, partial [candidate division Zixibacteria bacterium]|nr:hypothetical protein [candidate division Zixibacteria bacterium]NIS47328.1 hypothetical protein [candidate division Zixibacteria bacterium]NIV07530.1 hypothetical protein [candidate division Zixibacteria bacterium]NIW40308.1 hypothetical protein [candidate division Zixibacteria bacterium]